MNASDPPRPPMEVPEETLIDTPVSCEEIHSDLVDDVFGLLGVMGSNDEEKTTSPSKDVITSIKPDEPNDEGEARPSEDANKSIQPDEPVTDDIPLLKQEHPDDEPPQPEKFDVVVNDSMNQRGIIDLPDDELKGEDIIELGDDDHAEYAYPVLKDPEDGVVGDTIQPSQTLETQDSEEEKGYITVEGHYDEEDGQEIVYEKSKDWQFPKESKKQRFIFWGVVVAIFLIVIILAATLSGGNSKSLADVEGEAKNNDAQDGGGVAPGTTVPSGMASESPFATPLEGTNAPAPAAPPIVPNPVEALLFSISGPRLYEELSPQSRAFQVIANEPAQEDDEKTIQRYAVVTLLASLVDGDFPDFVQESECYWPFVRCTLGIVTQLTMSNLFLTGSIPPEVSSLTTLTKVDMSSNSIQGSIPEELFILENLQEIYLNNNQLTGTIPELIRDMNVLESLYLGQNLLAGGLPRNLPIRLRAMSFYKNNMDGEIPKGLLNSNSLFYVDLSFNSISGGLPNEPNAPNLRHLYLSHNLLEGKIPQGYENLEDFFADHNRFSGAPPTNFNKDRLFTLQLQGNNFDEEVDLEVCDLDIFSQGVLVDLAADCAICTCEGRLCEGCY